MFVRSQELMSREIREGLQTSATLSAMQISATDVEAVRGLQDRTKPEYVRLVQSLNSLRKNIPDARFTYIFRKTAQANTVAFVADGDALSSETELDFNKNGKIDSDEEPGLPGELYDVSDLPELQGPAFEKATVGNVYVDQWGALLSGFAPIKDANGKTVAVLGIDMRADQYAAASQSIFSPLSFLILLVIGGVAASIVGFIAWRRRVALYKRLDTERSGLVGLAMHQIGAPLASIRWWKDLLLEQEKDSMTPERKEAFEQISESIDRMSTLIDSLRRATSVHSGGLNYERLPSSLRDVIEDAVEHTSRLVTKKQQRVTITIPEDVHLPLDRKLIAGVVAELIENASWFSPTGREIQIRAGKKRKDILVEVQDYGYGIPDSDRSTVFHEFTRGSNAVKYKPVGNGLGLFVARGIIEMAGGEMWLQSSEGKGTTVSFTLPEA